MYTTAATIRINISVFMIFHLLSYGVNVIKIPINRIAYEGKNVKKGPLK
jgi:hypothetical protein